MQQEDETEQSLEDSESPVQDQEAFPDFQEIKKVWNQMARQIQNFRITTLKAINTEKTKRKVENMRAGKRKSQLIKTKLAARVYRTRTRRTRSTTVKPEVEGETEEDSDRACENFGSQGRKCN